MSIDIRETAPLALLKNHIKTWKCEDCSFRSWKIFIENKFGISNWSPLLNDRNLSINCSMRMRHICIEKFNVNCWNAIYSLWCYSPTKTVLFFVAVVVALPKVHLSRLWQQQQQWQQQQRNISSLLEWV